MILRYVHTTRKVVCICGSTRFRNALEAANKAETLKGNIVLTVGFFGHSDPEPPTDAQKWELDELHLEKIRIADEILIVAPGGYMGPSVSREMHFANSLGKTVKFILE